LEEQAMRQLQTALSTLHDTVMAINSLAGVLNMVMINVNNIIAMWSSTEDDGGIDFSQFM
jgi:hypothetical protein